MSPNQARHHRGQQAREFAEAQSLHWKDHRAMNLYVRTYHCLDAEEEGEQFYARAIIPVKGKEGKVREGHSIGFYADTPTGAATAAHQWIADERAKEDARKARNAALAEKRRSA